MNKSIMRLLFFGLNLAVVASVFSSPAGAQGGASTMSTPTAIAVQPAPVQPVPRITLAAVPSASSFSLGTPVALTLSLTNRSQTSIGLSNFIDGNIVLTAFSRNGQPVPSLPTFSTYGDGLPSALQNSLLLVAPNASISAVWTSNFNQELGGEGLLSITFTGADFGQGGYFSLAAAGSYSLTFYYQYKGPTAGFPGTVFTGKTNSVTVTFTVI